MKYCVHVFSKQKEFLFDTKEHLLKILKKFVQNAALMVTDDFHECSAWPCLTSWELYPYVCVLILGKVSNTSFIFIGRREVHSLNIQSPKEHSLFPNTCCCWNTSVNISVNVYLGCGFRSVFFMPENMIFMIVDPACLFFFFNVSVTNLMLQVWASIRIYAPTE